MSKIEEKKYEKIEAEIEKTIEPYIIVKISMPKGVDKEAFLKLEKDESFLNFLEQQTREWTAKNRNTD